MLLNILEEWNLHQPVNNPTPLAFSSSLNSPSTNKTSNYEYGGSMFLQIFCNLPPGYRGSHPWSVIKFTTMRNSYCKLFISPANFNYKITQVLTLQLTHLRKKYGQLIQDDIKEFQFSGIWCCITGSWCYEGDTVLWNVKSHLISDTALHPRRPESSTTQLHKPQNLLDNIPQQLCWQYHRRFGVRTECDVWVGQQSCKKLLHNPLRVMSDL